MLTCNSSLLTILLSNANTVEYAVSFFAQPLAVNCLPEDEPSSSLCSFVQRLNPFKTNVKRQKNKLNFTFDSENILTFF